MASVQDTPDVKVAHVALQLSANHEVPRDQLEADTIRVIDAITEGAGDVALGAVAACDFTSSTIELEFDIEHQSESEVHAKVGEVMRIVEGELELNEVQSQTASAPLVCA